MQPSESIEGADSHKVQQVPEKSHSAATDQSAPTKGNSTECIIQVHHACAAAADTMKRQEKSSVLVRKKLSQGLVPPKKNDLPM